MIFLGMLGDCAGTDNAPLPDTGTAPPVPPPLFAGLGRAGHHSRIIFVSTICGVGAVLFFFGPRLSVWVMTRLAPPELPPPELESVYVAPEPEPELEPESEPVHVEPEPEPALVPEPQPQPGQLRHALGARSCDSTGHPT